MHKSVLLQETIELLAPKEGGAYIDATLGAGGHSAYLAEKIGPNGRILGIDKDERALTIAKEKLAGKNVVFAKGDFAQIGHIAKENGFDAVDGIIMDLGVSSMQLDEAERGFSFSKSAKLDMRMDQEGEVTAADIVNGYSEMELSRILKEYGEEKESKKIARAIVKQRSVNPIITTDELSEVVRRVTRAPKWVRGKKTNTKINPATKVFQALRIETNQELFALESALPQAVSLLRKNGRISVISFHSLEDRIVKQFIEEESKTCKCPPEFPKCVCGTAPFLKKVTKKPYVASEEELSDNPRARSAKLRVAQKI